MPKNNQEFWRKKLEGNKTRDKFVNRELRKMGWAVVRAWEHELKVPAKVVGKIKRMIYKGWRINTSVPELNWHPIIPNTGNHIQPQGKRWLPFYEYWSACHVHAAARKGDYNNVFYFVTAQALKMKHCQKAKSHAQLRTWKRAIY